MLKFFETLCRTELSIRRDAGSWSVSAKGLAAILAVVALALMFRVF